MSSIYSMELPVFQCFIYGLSGRDEMQVCLSRQNGKSFSVIYDRNFSDFPPIAPIRELLKGRHQEEIKLAQIPDVGTMHNPTRAEMRRRY